MKKPNNKYLLFGLIGVIVIGAVVLLTQNSGQLFQGALLPTTTYSTTTTLTLDSVNKDLQSLKAKVASLETNNADYHKKAIESLKKNSEYTCAAFIYAKVPWATNMTICQSTLLNALSSYL